MDRTTDFFGVVEILRTHGGIAPSALAQLAGVQRLPPPSALQHVTKAIAKALKVTGRRVMRLYRLAHRKGLFDDPAAEINDLTAIIKAEVESLDGQLRKLADEIGRQYGSAPRDGPKAGPQGHWHAIADSLRANLLSITQTFQEALQLRSETMKEQSARRQQFAQSSWAPSLAGLPLDSPLFQAPQHTGPGMQQAGPGRPGATPPGSTGSGPSYADPSSPGNGRGYAGQASGQPSGQAALRRRPQVVQHPHQATGYGQGQSRAPLVAPAYSLGLGGGQQLSTMEHARASANSMASVEATILELGPLFTRMSGLVAEQGETLARIDADIDEASTNVEEGATELAKYLRSVQANRSFILKLFGVLAFVIILFGIFRR